VTARTHGLTGRAARIVEEFDCDPARIALLTRGSLRRRENIGKQTVNEIEEWLARHGFHFADYRSLQCPHCGKGINIVAKFTTEKET
jgi:site-specific recombinase XerC